MTFFGTIVSWLASGWIILRSVQLTWAWGMDRFGHKAVTSSRVSPAGPVHLFYSPVTLDGILLASIPWALCGVAILLPWVWPLFQRITRGKRPAGGDWLVWSNLAGRWICAGLILGSLMDYLPRPIKGFLTFDPYASPFSLGDYFTGIMVIVLWGLTAVLLIAPEAVRLGSSGFTGFIDSVFFPGARDKKPPYTIKLARFYVEKNRLDEAEAEFARMLKFYPQAPEAWQERLALAFLRERKLRSPAAAGEELEAHPAPQAVLAAGLKALRTAADQEKLHAVFLRQGS